MLSEQEIKQALRASHVTPVAVPAPHGPFGWEHLAQALFSVGRISNPSVPAEPGPIENPSYGKQALPAASDAVKGRSTEA